jgi:hypothetical protein
MTKEEILEKLLRLFKHNGVNNFIIPDDAELLYNRYKRNYYLALIEISSDKYKCRISWTIEGNHISITSMVFNHYVQDAMKPEKRQYQEWNDRITKLMNINKLMVKI